ncbi:MAG TPA: RNA polymerase sigma factor [Gemmatimonadaceae bacterium]|nr:RNA polymerase sigma factor [Gemmatimonadaceae bacterium]
MSDSTDAALAAAGDYPAFERLFRRYLSRIYSLCARLSGSRADGADLTEEVFVKAWRELPDFDATQTPFAPWLQRVATDFVLSRRDRDDNFTETFEPDSVELDLPQAIDGLPANARRIFVLHDVEGYKHEQIAEILGLTVGGSKAQLRQARVLLMKALER